MPAKESGEGPKSDTEATGRIRITKVPGGEAPFKIREAWMGIELPCHPFYGMQVGDERGVLSGDKVAQSRRAFTVPQAGALTALAAVNPDAAAWWRRRGYPNPSQYFSFAEDEAEIVSGVQQQQLFLAEEGCDGDPFR